MVLRTTLKIKIPYSFQEGKATVEKNEFSTKGRVKFDVDSVLSDLDKVANAKKSDFMDYQLREQLKKAFKKIGRGLK